MATDITLRSVKASALTHGEMDQNLESLSGTVDAKAISYTLLYTDQNKTIEFNGASLTATLPTLAATDGTDTDSWKVIIKNLHSTALTVDGSGAETIEGAASITLAQWDSVVLGLNSGATDWNILSVGGPNLLGITATKTEINTSLGGATFTAAEGNTLAGVTAGTAIASKAIVLDASKDSTGTNSFTAVTGVFTNITYGGAALTATAAELNYNDITTLGTSQASKVLTTDASNNTTIKGGAPTVTIESETDNATLIIQSGTDGLGVEESIIVFTDNVTNKWQLGKPTTNRFRLYNYNTALPAFEVYDTGGFVFGAATGGDPGAGKINAEGYQQDGVSVLARSTHTGTQTLSTISDAGTLAAQSTINETDVDWANSAGITQGIIEVNATLVNSLVTSTYYDIGDDNTVTTADIASYALYIPPNATSLEYVIISNGNVNNNVRINTSTNNGTACYTNAGNPATVQLSTDTGSVTISDKSGFTLLTVQWGTDSTNSVFQVQKIIWRFI